MDKFLCPHCDKEIPINTILTAGASHMAKLGAKSLTKAKRVERAKKAITARWNKPKPS